VDPDIRADSSVSGALHGCPFLRLWRDPGQAIEAVSSVRISRTEIQEKERALFAAGEAMRLKINLPAERRSALSLHL